MSIIATAVGFQYHNASVDDVDESITLLPAPKRGFPYCVKVMKDDCHIGYIAEKAWNEGGGCKEVTEWLENNVSYHIEIKATYKDSVVIVLHSE